MPRNPKITSVPGPGLGAPDVVSTTKAVANRAKQTAAMVSEATGLDLDIATAQAMWGEVSKDLSLAGMEPDAARAKVVKAIQTKGPGYWAQWLAGRQGVAPRSQAPAPRPASAPEPSAAALDEAVTGGDISSEAAPSRPAAPQGRTPANQAPSQQSKAMRAWLVRYGEMPQAEVDAMDDRAVAVAKARLQKSRSGQAPPADAKPAAQAGKRSRGRPRGSAAKPPQGESGVRRPAQTGSVVETEGEGVVNTVGDTPASEADLENLSPEKLEELLLKARVRQATRGSQIDVGRGPVGELPTMDVPPAGLGVGADEFVVNKFGGSQTTLAGAAPPPTPPPPPPPPGGGGPPDPPNDPPESDPFFKWPSDWFGTYKGAGGQTKDTVGRALLRRSPQIATGAAIAAALGGGAWWLRSGSGKPQVSQDELKMLRQRAIEGRMRNQELWGTYQDKPAPIQMAPPDMQAPPENNIRAFQRGVR